MDRQGPSTRNYAAYTSTYLQGVLCLSPRKDGPNAISLLRRTAEFNTAGVPETHVVVNIEQGSHWERWHVGSASVTNPPPQLRQMMNRVCYKLAKEEREIIAIKHAEYPQTPKGIEEEAKRQRQRAHGEGGVQIRDESPEDEESSTSTSSQSDEPRKRTSELLLPLRRPSLQHPTIPVGAQRVITHITLSVPVAPQETMELVSTSDSPVAKSRKLPSTSEGEEGTSDEQKLVRPRPRYPIDLFSYDHQMRNKFTS
ncbi:hypothetical protein Pst134EA_032268 [Puccinia striiformis f. sp. tritici]|uniref:uncharacterized protein n=1 Tax=Puccinia striiformis f. sp. tritici TaxID=168172 RepID=UPI0020087875|nr:uncharacterized protein Pst134EA_032268 [Puccinia striiformis f. sp. tritici]KAH9440677.1 hypothetical protein Pst134EA_032268 [Puccinia striiformis f. sp. tritici]